jgi:hypothetical protein
VRSDTRDTDDAVIERLLARDEAAFADLVAAYHGSLVRLALTFVTDRGAADEVVQETWLGVIKGLPSFEKRSSLKTWIFRILSSCAALHSGRSSVYGILNEWKRRRSVIFWGLPRLINGFCCIAHEPRFVPRSRVT